MSELENGFRLADLTSLIRRRATILIAAGVVGLLVGGFAYAKSPPKYSATSRVQVQPVITDPFAAASADTKVIDVATEQDLVKSDAVATAVTKKLGLQVGTRQLLQQVIVTSKENSLVLEITFVSGDAEMAQAGANAFGDAYLAERRKDAEAEKKKQLGLIQAKIDYTRLSLQDAVKSGDKTAIAEFNATLSDLNQTYITFDTTNTGDVGRVVRRAGVPAAVLSKMALGKAVGLFGLCLIAGLGLALLVDRTDSLGGGRRKIEQILPNAGIRLMPAVTNSKATEAEVDAAIDRFAIELTSGSRRGRATAVVMVSTWSEPPLALAQDVAASLGFAGIPALFVIAASTTAEVGHARVVTDFGDLIDDAHLSGPYELPEVADLGATKAPPKITWLRPRGSAEASGLLRRAVVESLITRASRDGFEVVVFLASTPTRNAAAVALGRWVDKVVIIVAHGDDHTGVEQTAAALAATDARVTEVVWT